MNLNNKWLWMLGVVGLMGCGVSSQSDAVTVAARNNLWSVEACDDHINSKNFDSCQDAIKVLSCGSIVDQALLVAEKCPRNKVCSGNP